MRMDGPIVSFTLVIPSANQLDAFQKRESETGWYNLGCRHGLSEQTFNSMLECWVILHKLTIELRLDYLSIPVKKLFEIDVLVILGWLLSKNVATFIPFRVCLFNLVLCTS